MNYVVCYCKFEPIDENLDNMGPIIVMEYQGKGIWKCPECGYVQDRHDIVYFARVRFFKVIEGEDDEWTNVEILDPYDKRLDVAIEKGANSIMKCLLNDIFEEDIPQKHELGTFDCEILYHWYSTYYPECGTEWDMDLIIVTEKKVEK